MLSHADEDSTNITKYKQWSSAIEYFHLTGIEVTGINVKVQLNAVFK